MSVSEAKLKRSSRVFQDIFVLLIMSTLLYYGAVWQLFAPNTDAARYQCYAIAFWQGLPALRKLSDFQCAFLTHPEQQHLLLLSRETIVNWMHQVSLPDRLIRFVAAQSTSIPFHTLPYEYPLLTLIPFSLGMTADPLWYQVAFAIWMLVVAALLYPVLVRWQSRRAALAYTVYIVIGGWATLAGRFDIFPAALTLLALLCSAYKRWNWAFALLALSTLLKFYPVVLLPPFLLAQQLAAQGPWYTRRRWAPPGVFILVCVVIISISLLLSVEGTLAPLNYFGYRPVQVESLSASILWLAHGLGIGSLSYAYTFGSLNMLGSLSNVVSLCVSILVVAGIMYTYWLLWRAKIDLATACLLTLLIVMLTSKVFSPQYLIWVIPLLAYIGETRCWWLLPWCLISLLTTWIYPYIYTMTPSILDVPSNPLFFPITTVRNLLLLGWVVALLIYSNRKGFAAKVPGTVCTLRATGEQKDARCFDKC
ncbi:MAG: hypothetical protein NVS2B12_00780 [Ktedonobacteraceae bacterium]